MNDSTRFNQISVRVVTADYYLSTPIPELDVAFSEFRGCEIKQLPILRIFGATHDGIKSCVHIHGVFPYLYIPCDDPKPEPKIAYQIANSIDKALNISLKQAHSNVQHVYKVILVQGIPFYGFHTKPHQFYKIFFYNPVFVKRVADLLQNGAILGLSYQPHEAHINFTMQFFLDFNLYGMSHINMQNVKFRRNPNLQGSNSQNELLYLPDSVKYTSCCEYEVDCLAENILNRRDVINGNLGANPGLEALWEDEKTRRKHLDLSETLVPTQSQTRENVPQTDSHEYHARRLLVKLALNSEAIENSENLTLSILNDTLSESLPSDKITSPIVDTKCLNNSNKSIYPAETPMGSQIINATFVHLHHPSSVSNKSGRSERYSDESNFFVDESVVLQCSQNQRMSQVSLDTEDIEFMELLKDMDGRIEDDSILGSQGLENVEVNEGGIEDDSILGSQSIKNVEVNEGGIEDDSILGSQGIKNVEVNEGGIEDDSILGSQGIKNVEVNEGGIEDDSILGSQHLEKFEESEGVDAKDQEIVEDTSEHDATLVNADQCIDKISSDESTTCSPSVWNDTFWDDVQNISQLDGAWDDAAPDDHKRFKRKLKVGLSKPVRRSARNIKPVLPVTPMKSATPAKTSTMSPKCTSIHKKIEDFQSSFPCIVTSPKKSPSRLRRKLSSLKILQESPPFRENQSPNKITKTSSRKLKMIKCQLNDVKTEPGFTEPLNVKPVKITANSSVPVILKSNAKEMNDMKIFAIESDEIQSDKYTNSRNIDEDTAGGDISFQILKQTEPLLMNLDDSVVEKEKYMTSSQYDRQNDFFPQAGSSTITVGNNRINSFNYEKIISSGSTEEMSESLNGSPSQNADFGIISFYDTTIYQDKTITRMGNNVDDSQNIILHYDTSPEGNTKRTNEKLCNKSLSKYVSSQFTRHKSRRVILTPKIDPPSCDYVISTLDSYNIPHHVNEQPFYSDYKDVGHQIEIGQVVLKLRSKSLADLKRFESSVEGLISIEKLREELFMKNSMSQPCEIKDLKSFLASNRRCVLTPAISPPTRRDVLKWITQNEVEKVEEGLEIVPEKVTYCVPSSPDQNMNGSQMDLISLSPFSPLSNTSDIITYSPAALSNQDNETPNIKSTLKKKKFTTKVSRNLRPRALHLSLSQNNRKSVERSSPLPSSQGSTDSSEFLPCGQDVNSPSNKGHQESDHVTMEKVVGNQEVANSPGNMNATLGFKFSGENYQNAVGKHEHEFLTILVMEVLTSTRGEMTPDPEKDPILAVFYCVTNDCPADHTLPQRQSGVIFTKDDKFKAAHNKTAFSHYEGLNKLHHITEVDDEKTLFQETLSLIAKWNPDILCGYEIELLSWGYLVQRGFVIDINMASEISRVKQNNSGNWKRSSPEVLNKEVKLTGRIMLDVWRVLRHEIALTSYSFENIFYHIMHERVPKFSHKTLYFWWNHPSGLLRSMTMEYYFTRVIGIINLLNHLDFVGRTSELARLFGIQWYEVLSRGSQFRVESMMIRMTRPRNYVLVSPNIQQRAAMKAPECIPLVMEPESRFYNDPVIVLDFQSLYPSVMIAYNYCYSTCLGKVNNMGRDVPFVFGCTQLKVSPKMLERLHKKNLINWSPCGVGFVKKEVRHGVLPTMLQDILGTRLMVKKAMKKHKKDKTLQKILHSRQLGLKLIANVTYGYTSANFSGRMPCMEVGDSVVSKGRETLERAIKLVENTPKWNARVVYGDTDSIFVLVAGRDRSEAFDIGAEIAEAVTNDNPTPIKLKLEKVYQPCILQTKKRYVGYMYESKDQTTPVYDAKGIETVRRDGCPATAKMLEKTLRILFETLDMSRVKSYVCREFQKILEGRSNIKDFVFAKEFRGIGSYKPGAAIPALEIAKQQKSVDPRSEPRESERVAYVMVCGAPGEALMRLARPPLSLLSNPSLQLNYSYYILRQIIPPLNRCLTLLGVDVNQWFTDLPRKQYQMYPLLDEQGKETEGKKSTISQYFAKINCPGCEVLTAQGLCDGCMGQPQKTMMMLHNRVNAWQKRHLLLKKMCQSCCGRSRNIECVSIDCPVLFSRAVAMHRVEQVPFINKMMEKLTNA